MSIFNGAEFEQMNSSEADVFKTVKVFFIEVERDLAKVPDPDMEDLSRFKKASYWDDEMSQKLLFGNEFSTAMFVRLFAQEMFCQISICLAKHYTDNEKRTFDMEVNCDCRQDAGNIWAIMNTYDHIKGSEIKKIQISLGWVIIYVARFFFPLVLVLSIIVKTTSHASNKLD